MEINSYPFILFFLPIVLVLYYSALHYHRNRIAYWILIAASALFYAINCTEFSLLMLGSIVVNYVISRALLNMKKSALARVLLAAGILADLSILFWYKYFNFITGTMNAVLGTDILARELLMPLGISFVAFQKVAFLVDSYRGETRQYSFPDYLLYISYFPHVSMGPIMIHEDFDRYLGGKSLKIDYNMLAQGIYMFAMGFGKKVLIADVLSKSVDWGFSNTDAVNSTEAIFLLIVYALQIYYDFSGYCDMAWGVSKMLQIDLPLNFNSPYKGNTIIDFWDRWHITLTRFFRKYVYFPLGGSRKGLVRTYINIMIIFVVSGLWHGATWSYVAWGAANGVFMILTRLCRKMVDRLPNAVNALFFYVFFIGSLLLFRAGSFSTVRAYAAALLAGRWEPLSSNVTDTFIPQIVKYSSLASVPSTVYCLVIVGVILVATRLMKNVREVAEEQHFNWLTSVIIAVVMIMSLSSLTGISSFVYKLF